MHHVEMRPTRSRVSAGGRAADPQPNSSPAREFVLESAEYDLDRLIADLSERPTVGSGGEAALALYSPDSEIKELPPAREESEGV